MGQIRTPLGFRAIAASTAVLSATSTLVSIEATFASGHAPSYPQLLLLNTAYWCLWAAFAPLIVRTTQRFPFERNSWLRPLAVHVPLAFLFAFVQAVLLAAVRRPIAILVGRKPPASFWWAVQQSGLQTLDWNMMAYWMIVGAALAVSYREEARLREMAAARLHSELVHAQLRSLQSQLHPHFLFNALNSVSALMHRDVHLAERTLARIGGLLRATLRDPNRQEVPLREELEFTKNYLEIERTRFEDRLSVRFDVSPETLDALVPWMLLQPLVENAVKHGIAPQGRPGTIEIIALRDRDTLKLAVRDDGAGFAAGLPDAATSGIGLNTTRARLQHRFGDDHEFELRPRHRGVEVRVAIPWRSAPPDAGVLVGGDPA